MSVSESIGRVLVGFVGGATSVYGLASAWMLLQRGWRVTAIWIVFALAWTITVFILLKFQERVVRAIGVDPVSWTPEDVERSSRWERGVRSDIHRSCSSS